MSGITIPSNVATAEPASPSESPQPQSPSQQPAPPASAGPLTVQRMGELYDEEQRNQEQAREQKLFAAYRLGLKADPAMEREAHQIGVQLGIPREEVPTDIRVARELMKERAVQYQELRQRYPSLVDLMSDVRAVAMTHDDLGNLKAHADTFDWIKRNLSAGWATNERGYIGARKLLGIGDAGDDERLLEIQATRTEDPGFLANTFQLLGQMVGTTVPSMAIGGGAATVASLGGPISAGTAFTVASGTTAFALSSALEAGNQYVDMIDAGIDPKSAKVAASLYGGAAGSLEAVGLHYFAAPAKAAFGRIVGGIAARGLAQRTATQALWNFGKEYAKGVGAEVATEMAQEVMGVTAQELARRWSNPNLPGQTLGQAAQQVADVGWKTFQGMALIGLPLPVGRAVVDMSMASQARRTQQFFGELAKNAEASKIAEKAPDVLSAFIASTAKGGAETTYVSGEAMVEALKQSEVSREQLRQIAPAVDAQIDEAVASGGDVKIPTGEFASRILRTDLGEALLPHARLDPNARSAAELEQFLPESKKFAEEAQAAIVQHDEQATAYRESAKRVEDSMLAQLRTAGQFQDREARAGAAYYRELVSGLARAAGQLPDAFDAEHGLVVERAAPSRTDQNRPTQPTQPTEGATPTRPDAAPAAAAVTEFTPPPAGATPVEQIAHTAQQLVDAVQSAQQSVPASGEPVPGTAGTGEPMRHGQKGTARADFNPKTRRTTLHEKADISSFLHESAHYFLTMLGQLASVEGAAPQVVEQMQKLLDWFGIKDLETWNAMSLDQQRKYHERFAYSFEIYLSEGKAPTRELRSLFDRFAAWLRRIYTAIRDQLNATYRTEFGEDLPALTGEVRAVMDRMVASEQDIAVAQMQRFESRFDSQEQSGLSDAEWSRYLDLRDQRNDEAVADLSAARTAKMQFLDNARSKILKERQKLHDAERERIRKEVVRQVQQNPRDRARRWLRSGQVLNEDGTTTKEGGAHKLDATEVRVLLRLEERRAATPAPTPDFRPEEPARPVRETREERAIRLAAEQDMRAQEAARTAEQEAALRDARDKANASAAMQRLKGMVAETGGLNPDVVAEKFGFTTGEALVRALVEMREFGETVDQLTNERMVREHGDLVPGTKEHRRAVAEALHGEVAGELLAVELKQLAKFTGSLRVLRAQARDAAETALRGKALRDIRVSDFEAAESRAAREGAKALAGGNVMTAAEWKRREVLQHEMARAAVRIEREVEDTIDGWKRFAQSDDKLRKQRDVDIVNVGRDLLAAHNVISTRGNTVLLQKNDPEKYAEYQPILDQWQSRAKDYRSMPLQDFRDLREVTDWLWFRSKRSRQIEADGRMVLREEAIGELLAQIQSSLGPPPPAATTLVGSNDARKGFDFSGIRAKLWRVEHLMRKLDGGKAGPFTKYIFAPLRERFDRYMADRETMLSKVRDSISALTLSDAKIEARADELQSQDGSPVVFDGTKALLGALQHAGNLSNLERLLLGMGWTPKIVLEDGTVTFDPSGWWRFVRRMTDEGKLTKEHFDHVQRVWDMNERELKPRAQQVNRDIAGVYFKEIDATPISTPWGEYRGGYMPATPDPDHVANFDLPIRQQADAIADMDTTARESLPGVTRGFTIERAAGVHRPLILDIRLQAGHLDQVLRLIHLQPAIRDALSIIKSRDFAATLNRYDPTIIREILLPWLQDVAANRMTQSSTSKAGKAFDRFWSMLRRNVGLSIMFSSIRNAAQQLTGFSNASVYVKGRFLRSALLKRMQDREGTARFVSDSSVFMRNRIDGQIGQIQDDIDFAVNPSWQGKIARWTNKHGYWAQRLVQNQVDLAVWLGGYDQAMARSNPAIDADRAHRLAVSEADAAVRMSQGSSTSIDSAGYERSSALVRLLTQFSSYFNVVLNQVMASKPGAERVTVAAQALVLPALAAAAIAAVASGGQEFDDKDDNGVTDEVLWWMFSTQIKAAGGLLPGVGSLASRAITGRADGFGDRLAPAPAWTAVEALGKTISNLTQVTMSVGDAAEFQKAKVRATGGAQIRDAFHLVSIATGLPLMTVGKPLAYLRDVGTGKVKPTSAVDFARGVITGQSSKASR